MSNAAKKIINRNAFGGCGGQLSRPRAPAASRLPMPMPRQSAAMRAPTLRTSSRPGPGSTRLQRCRSECGRRASWPVGRVLCTRSRGPAAIHLGLPLLTASCGLPASSGGPPSNARAGNAPAKARPPLDLAPGGVYLAARVTPGAGGLLHRRFTLTSGSRRRRSVFCGTIPRVTPGRRYRPPCPAEPGPSSAQPGIPGTAAAARPARPPLQPR
jgi:hypothetical protein